MNFIKGATLDTKLQIDNDGALSAMSNLKTHITTSLPVESIEPAKAPTTMQLINWEAGLLPPTLTKRGIDLIGYAKGDSPNYSCMLSQPLSLKWGVGIEVGDIQLQGILKGRSVQIPHSLSFHLDEDIFRTTTDCNVIFNNGRTALKIASSDTFLPKVGFINIGNATISVMDTSLLSPVSDILGFDKLQIQGQTTLTHGGTVSNFNLLALDLIVDARLVKSWKKGAKTSIGTTACFPTGATIISGTHNQKISDYIGLDVNAELVMSPLLDSPKGKARISLRPI